MYCQLNLISDQDQLGRHHQFPINGGNQSIELKSGDQAKLFFDSSSLVRAGL